MMNQDVYDEELSDYIDNCIEDAEAEAYGYYAEDIWADYGEEG